MTGASFRRNALSFSAFANMPKYHFDIRENGTCHCDDEGEERGDRQAAEAEARKVAVEMIRHGLIPEGQVSRTVEVREDGGDPFLRLHVIAKIEVERLK
jgi:hypothetical protein